MVKKRSDHKVLGSLLLAGVIALSAAPGWLVGNGGNSLDASAALGKPAIAQADGAKPATHKLRNVMYLGDWSHNDGQGKFFPSGVQSQYLTHLNYAFQTFDRDGNLRGIWSTYNNKENYSTGFMEPNGFPGSKWEINGASGYYPAMQQLRLRNPNLKIGTSFGGWSQGANFTWVARDESKRQNFIEQMIRWLRYTDTDFVDLDWEYPAYVRQADKEDNANDTGTPDSIPEDKQNYVTLLKEMREALDTAGKEDGKYYEMSAAVPAGQEKVDLGIDVPGLYKYLDFVNIMTYDMHGAYEEYTGHHTALYPNPKDLPENKDKKLTVSETVDYYLQLGAIPEKTVVGTAFYTRGWGKVAPGSDENLPGLFQKALPAQENGSIGAKNHAPIKSGDGGSYAGNWSFGTIKKGAATNTLMDNYPGLVEYWDDTAKAPYLYDKDDGAFFTYDNERSIGEKGKYVRENGLGGLISWMASNDATPDNGEEVGKWENSTNRSVLTKACKESLFGETDIPKLPIQSAPNKNIKLEVVPTTATAQNGSTEAGFKVSMKNTGAATETLPLLQAAQANYNIVVCPELQIKGKFRGIGNWQTNQGITVAYQDGYTNIKWNGSPWNQTSFGGGKTYPVSLGCDTAGCANPLHGTRDEIEEVTMTKKFDYAGAVVAEQVLRGKDWAKYPLKTTGLADDSMEFGTEFDPRAGVTIEEPIGENQYVPLAYSVTGAVDTSKSGDYVLFYKAVRKNGTVESIKRTVTVKKAAGTNPPTITKTIGDQTVDYAASVNVTNTSGGMLAALVATDEFGNDIKANVVVSGDIVKKKNTKGEDTKQYIIDTLKPGEHVVIYTVTDSNGNTTRVKNTVTARGVAAWDETKAYQKDNYASYDGKIYQTKGWTPSYKNPPPDNDYSWKLVGNLPGALPVISGIADKSVTMGAEFDPMADVTASVGSDDITTSVVVSGDMVDTNVARVYNLTYSVTHDGETVTKYRQITVLAVERILPVFGEVADISIRLGEKFDLATALKGVGAVCGGLDVSTAITVAGVDAVDTTVEGSYTLTYQVTIREESAEITRTVKVVGYGREYSANSVYHKDDIVLHGGESYACQKSTVQNTAPGSDADTWVKVVSADLPIVDYDETAVYFKNTVVRFDGKLYQARRFAKARPGLGRDWVEIRVVG